MRVGSIYKSSSSGYGSEGSIQPASTSTTPASTPVTQKRSLDPGVAPDTSPIGQPINSTLPMGPPVGTMLTAIST